MERDRPLVPKPDAPHGYFWTIWTDWGLVAKIGLGFVAIVCLFTFATQLPEVDHQRESFQKALESLAGTGLHKPLIQKEARLLKEKNLYSWRAIVWLAEDGGQKPCIWQAQVLKEGQTYKIVAATLEPYQTEKARSLELLNQWQKPAVAP